MTSIKPPDGRSPIGPIGPSSGSREPEAAERTGPSFRETLAGPSPTAAGAAAAQGAANADPIATLAQAVKAGSVSPDQALEHLVERAVSGMARRLTQAQRAELTEVLREAVQSDPALRQLRDALG
jgi:hypothetical protein